MIWASSFIFIPRAFPSLNSVLGFSSLKGVVGLGALLSLADSHEVSMPMLGSKSSISKGLGHLNISQYHYLYQSLQCLTMLHSYSCFGKYVGKLTFFGGIGSETLSSTKPG